MIVEAGRREIPWKESGLEDEKLVELGSAELSQEMLLGGTVMNYPRRDSKTDLISSTVVVSPGVFRLESV